MTPLGYALLGLIKTTPSSGYALRRMFGSTWLSMYSSSPGSIYPALKSLEKLGLIATEPAAKSRTVFVLTKAGQSALKAWLLKPVTPDEVSEVEDLLLRFGLMSTLSDQKAVFDFLKSFALSVREQIVAVKAIMTGDSWPDLPLHHRLITEHRLRSLEASAQWTMDAYSQLSLANAQH